MPSATKTPFEKGVLDSLKLLIIYKCLYYKKFLEVQERGDCGFKGSMWGLGSRQGFVKTNV